MGRGDVFFAGMTKSVLRSTIQQRLKAYTLDEVFEDELVSDLIAQKHYYCSINDLRPTHFRKLFRAGGGYNFQGLFMPTRWHGVSWAQCLAPRDQNEWIEAALRDAVHHIVAGRKHNFQTCEKCGLKPSTEVDHVDPEFSEITRRAMEVMSSDDFAEVFSRFDWWSEKRFDLPLQNPALLYTLDAHKTAQLQAVCKDCHLKNAKDRKAARHTKARRI